MFEVIRRQRKIIITGGVAVGKSTVIDQLLNKFRSLSIPYLYIPEYIDGDPKGEKILEEHLNGLITAFDFQLYTVNYYNKYLSSLNVHEDMILIFERTPEDSILCFAKKNLDNGKLTSDEYNMLRTHTQYIMNTYNIPSYGSQTNIPFVVLQQHDVYKTVCLIQNMIEQTKTDIIFGLQVSPQICYRRMKDRNRPGEAESYDENIINAFNKYYDEIYQTYADKQS